MKLLYSAFLNGMVLLFFFSSQSCDQAVTGENQSEIKAQASCKHSDGSFNCVQYIQNYDGDTIHFDIPGIHPFFGNSISVRVKSVDTPEMNSKDSCEKEYANKAKQYVAKVLQKAKRIDLVNISKGKYFRIVADVMVDGESLSDKILQNDYAVRYDGGTKSKVDWCKYL